METRKLCSLILLCSILLTGIFSFYQPQPIAHAVSVDELRDQIQEREAKIKALEEDIQQYKQEIKGTTAQRQTLQAKITELEKTQRKLEAELEVTQNQIFSTELSIKKLGFDINDKEERIELNRSSIAEAIRESHQTTETALIEAILLYDNISEFWSTLTHLERIQDRLNEEVNVLRVIKTQLEEDREETVSKKEELEDFETNLANQEDVVAYNKKNQKVLLEETSNKEAEYQRLLKTKEELREAFMREINNLESALQIAIDKNKYPTAGTSVFAPPLADIAKKSCWDDGGLDFGNCITQFFGNTPFAQAGAYNGNTHNGADFRSVVGEKLFAPANGTVIATGNTDIGRCLSYGKWILVEHDNGLSNLFAHLSQISVSSGQNVSTGDIIGYTGATGYATGPHLHMSTLASEGVQVINIGDHYRQSGRAATTPCSAANVRIPVAPHDAYLNPLSYL